MTANSVQVIIEAFGQVGGIPITLADLTVRTNLKTRTVRYAIRQLSLEGRIIKKFNLRDARRPLYSLKPVPAQ